MFSIEIKTVNLPKEFSDLKSYSQWINKFLGKVGKVKVQFRDGDRYEELAGYVSFVYTESQVRGSIFDIALVKIYKDKEKKILAKILYDKAGKESPFPIEIRVSQKPSFVRC